MQPTMTWLTRLSDTATRGLGQLWRVVVNPGAGGETDEKIAEQARAKAPIVWLIGKAQSGKTSIVRALTGAPDAEIGSGFKPCTRTARIFDFPADAPVIRFLDTRGLGEPGYDPAEDIAKAAEQAHLVLVVTKALDHEQGAVRAVLRTLRREHPDWPVLVAQTSLHEGYAPGAEHPAAYPFGPDGLPLPGTNLPQGLVRSLIGQRHMFDALAGSAPVRFVPIDFTREGDGYEPVSYGFDALIERLREVAPEGLVASLAAEASGNARAKRAHPHIMGYAAAAGAADAVPVAGIVAVPGVQAKMLHSIGEIYGVAWDRRTLGEFVAALGAGTAVKALAGFGARELGKLVPVYGQTAGAAAAAVASFAMTFALGKAACVFLARRRRGESGMGAVAEAYRAALTEAFKLAAIKRGAAKEPAVSEREGA